MMLPDERIKAYAELLCCVRLGESNRSQHTALPWDDVLHSGAKANHETVPLLVTPGLDVQPCLLRL